MTKTVRINGISIEAENFKQEKMDGRVSLSFQFHVTSEAYHEITTLLYRNDFKVEVPDESLTFHGVIHRYSTSITNLYEENQVGEFTLQLIEKE